MKYTYKHYLIEEAFSFYHGTRVLYVTSPERIINARKEVLHQPDFVYLIDKHDSLDELLGFVKVKIDTEIRKKLARWFDVDHLDRIMRR